ncbi:hypothetical protein CO049_03825 [Candidatus Roizmanbacteria bacterium CG_4_9_14_0_2_um_filter_36_12]|uniref:Uncharacterized protein n=1 Tax=Candidatus Roizmanbacteria bacterium CG_4_9_14_0_2_um_filter_36_12 TaxID=1974837 RepID=A0A2M8EYS7_9BACT|nr:MAG: hypothetical protein CO049_03825 [Candidatus Roizmanbacteria bacterium CG_4_9_14_0_2_um_filter_36_12]
MKHSQKTSLLFIETAAGNRPLTDMEKCFLTILKIKNNISSRQALKLARKIKLCAACSDRSEVFTTGEKLSKKGLVERRLIGKEYFWSLSKKGTLYSKQI